MRYGPPANPTEGQEWKSGRDRYRFQVGKGWVDASLYRPPAEPVFVTVVNARKTFRTEPDPDAVTGCADDQAFVEVTPEAARKALAAHVGVKLCACGAAIGPKPTVCRACHYAALRAKAGPKPPERRCAGPGCDKVLSAGAKTGLCKSCWHAEQAAKRPPKPPPALPKFRPDPAEVERVRRAAERIDQNAIRRAQQREQAERRAIEQAARVVVKVPANVPRPEDPLAKRERAKPHVPAKDPLDSDAFRAQLERVKAGAGIVTVKPVSKREGVGAPTGSSLTNF